MYKGFEHGRDFFYPSYNPPMTSSPNASQRGTKANGVACGEKLNKSNQIKQNIFDINYHVING